MSDYMINKTDCDIKVSNTAMTYALRGLAVGLALGILGGYVVKQEELTDKYKELSDRYDIGMRLYQECTNDRAILRGRRIVR